MFLKINGITRFARDPIGGSLQNSKKLFASGELVLIFSSSLMKASFQQLLLKIKNPADAGLFWVLRRKRDSNPRYLAVQRFSRPPHSTTLPFLRILKRTLSYTFQSGPPHYSAFPSVWPHELVFALLIPGSTTLPFTRYARELVVSLLGSPLI